MKDEGDIIRRIFFSDVHMGDARGIAHTDDEHPYCWFYDNSQRASTDDRPGMLARFIEDVCSRGEEVHEVVILGDLFDEWVCPATYPPIEPCEKARLYDLQLQKIVDATHNGAVVAGLKELSESGKLVYLRGNHDMLVDSRAMEDCFHGVKCVFSESCCDTYKTDDAIWVEHGHQYGLFNAPHLPLSQSAPFGRTILPLGFFISRLDAQKTLKRGERLNTFDVFMGWLENLGGMGRAEQRTFADQVKAARDGWFDSEEDRTLMPPDTLVTRGLAESIAPAFDSCIAEGFAALTENDWAPPEKEVVMDGFGEIPHALPWAQVKDRYDKLFSGWEDHRGSGVTNWEALICDTGTLSPAAHAIFKLKEAPRIIILGHTHKPFLASNGRQIYVNTGAWENHTPLCTFVETEYDRSKRTHHVALKVFAADGHSKVEVEDTIHV